MKVLKVMMTALAALILPALGWAETTKWTDITASLPGATSSQGTITSFHSGDFSGKQGTVAGAMVALEKWLTINPGEVKVAWNQNTAGGTTGGDAEGAEGYWSENHSITLWGRSGISGMSAAIALKDNATLNELKIKQVRVTGKVRGSYTNANSQQVNTASGSCALAVGVARYDGSAYVCAAAAGAQATGGDGSDVAFTATLDIPYADVKAWNASGTNNDKIILTVSTPSANWSNVYIVQIDKVEYLTLEAYAVSESKSIRIVPGTDANWTTESEWAGGVPTAEKNTEIEASGDAALTMNENSATLGELTISGEGSLTFDGSSTLSATATTVNADTDVSGITASLGAVTVAAEKTLTIGDDMANVLTSVAGDGTLKFVGGTAGEPLIYDISGYNIAIGGNKEKPSYVKVGPTKLQGNNKHIIIGNGPDCSYIYLGTIQNFGLMDGTAIKNVTLIHSENYTFWWERGDFSNTVLQAESTVLLNNSFNPVIAGLKGRGAITHNRSEQSHTVTIATKSANGNVVYEGTLIPSANKKKNVKVVISGDGMQTFSGANTYANGTEIKETATLSLVSSGTLGTGGVSVASGATLAVEVAEGTTKTMENAISGAGALTVSGNGTLVLSAANKDFAGKITIKSGATLDIAAPEFTGDSFKSFKDGATIIVEEGATLKLTSGGGFFSVTGEGTVKPVGEDFIFGLGDIKNTLSANIVVDNGSKLRLRAFGNSSSVTGGNITISGGGSIVSDYVNQWSAKAKITIADGKKLAGSGTIGTTVDNTKIPVTFAAGSSIDATAGAVTLSGTATYNGAVAIKIPAEVTDWATGVPVLKTAQTLPTAYTIKQGENTLSTKMLIAKTVNEVAGIYAVELGLGSEIADSIKFSDIALQNLKNAAAAANVTEVTSVVGATINGKTVNTAGLELFNNVPVTVAADGKATVSYAFGIESFTIDSKGKVTVTAKVDKVVEGDATPVIASGVTVELYKGAEKIGESLLQADASTVTITSNSSVLEPGTIGSSATNSLTIKAVK